MIDETQTLLLEIGSEEIPAGYIRPAMDMIEESAQRLLKEYAVSYREIKTYATPRRLALLINGVGMLQEGRIREYFGPPKNAAYDSDGRPTPAALNFAKAQGVGVDALLVKKREKREGSGVFGEYVACIIEEKGLPVTSILGEIFRKIVTSITFPKTMRWGNGSTRYARPLRWILAMADTVTIEFEYAGIRSSNITYGHRFLSNKEIVVSSPGSYEQILQENYVIVDNVTRSGMIKEQLEEIARRIGTIPVDDNELIDIVTNLVEYPTGFAASFSEGFLRLPKELLISVMRDHQKYFALSGLDGKGLANSFIVISNTVEGNEKNVVEGAERVLRARFDDARFYFEEDRKVRLIERTELLKKVAFQEGLGDMFEKTGRIVALSERLYDRLSGEWRKGQTPDRALVTRAAAMAKADLTTGVVREFTELQGIIGGYYARLDGEDDELCTALGEQYLHPVIGNDKPETFTGTILSLADKIDNISSFFRIGLIPTGSKDPYALRRQSAYIIIILLNNGFSLTFSEMFIPTEELRSFLKNRLESAFSDFAHDEVAAALNGFMDLPIFYIRYRLDAITRLKGHPEYNKILFAFKRVHNIIPDDFSGTVDKKHFEFHAENGLYDAIDSIRKELPAYIDRGEFNNAIDLLISIIPVITRFFDDVLVMDKDEEKKRNRLALLASLNGLISKVVDFSKLSEA